MADEIGSLVVKLAMSDASFKEGIQNLNRQMRLIDSDFKKTMSVSQDFGQTIDGLKAKSQYLSESISTQRKILTEYQSALKKSKQNLEEISLKQVDLKQKIESTKVAYETSRQQLGKNAEETKKLKDEYNNLSNEYTQNEKKIRTYVKQIDNHNLSINKAETAINKYTQELKQTQTAITSASSKFLKFEQQIKSLGKSMTDIGSKMSDIGRKMSTAITAPVTLAGTAAIKMGADFEQGMAQVSAISGATGYDLEKLEDKARQMGATTIFSASDAAEGLQYMAMAGWRAGDMIDGLEGIMNLAAASGEDLGLVSDIVTDALTAFGLSAKESSRFADVLAKASSASNTNVAMMGETFKYVAPIAGALGYSIEDTSVAIGLMANSGIKASQAGTSLRQILMGLQGDTEVVSDSFGKMTIHVTNSDGTMKEFEDVVLQLRDAFSKMTEEEKAMNAESIAGKVGMSGLLAIVNASEKDFNKLTEAVSNSNGAAKQMSEIMNNTVKGSFEIFLSALEELAIQVFDRLEPALRNIISTMTEWVESFMSLPVWVQDTVLAITGLIAIAGPLLAALGAMTSAIGKLFTSFSSFKLLLSPTGLALGALATAIGLVITQVVKHQMKQKALNEELEKTQALNIKGIESSEQAIEQAKTEMGLLQKQVDAYNNLENQHKSNIAKMEELAQAMIDARDAGDYETVEKLTYEYNNLQNETASLTPKLLQMEKTFGEQNMTVEMAKERLNAYNKAIIGAEKEVEILNSTTDENAKAMAQEAISLSQTAREGKLLSQQYMTLAAKQNLTKEETRQLEQIKQRLISVFGMSVVSVDNETGVLTVNANALREEIFQHENLSKAKLSAVQACNEGSKSRLKAQKAEAEGVIKALKAELQTYQYVEDIMNTRQEIINYEQSIAQIDSLLSAIAQSEAQASRTISSANEQASSKSDERVKKTKENTKTQLEIAMEAYEQKRKLGEISFEQELALLQEMRNKHAKTKDEIIQVNEFAQDRIVELIEFRKQKEDLTLQEELALYETAKNSYCKNEQDKLDFNQLINDAIVQHAVTLTENLDEMNVQQLQAVKDKLEEQKYIYQDNKYAVEQIDKEILEVKKQLYEEEVLELSETVDKLIEERKRQYEEELALIDQDLNDEVAGYEEKLKAIERLEEEERIKEREKSYEKKIQRLEDKLAEEQDYKEREQIRQEISEAEAERDKWREQEKRKEQKQTLKDAISNAKEEAKLKKEAAKEAFEEEQAAMKEHQEFQKQWLEQKMLNSSLSEQEITRKVLDELEQREKDLQQSMLNQMAIYRGQIPDVETVGTEYGKKILQGIQSTEHLIDSYISRKMHELKSKISDVSFESSYSSPSFGSFGTPRAKTVEQPALFDLKTFNDASKQSMNSMLEFGKNSSRAKSQNIQVIEQKTQDVNVDVDMTKVEQLLEKLNNKLDRLPKSLRQEVRMG